jgi:hypothetical protein
MEALAKAYTHPILFLFFWCFRFLWGFLSRVCDPQKKKGEGAFVFKKKKALFKNGRCGASGARGSRAL